MKLERLMGCSLGQHLGQLRAAPVRTERDTEPAILAVYAADSEIDPYIEMFFFPTDTLKLALIAPDGEILWRRDLGPAVVPGLWFCPVLPFDLDGDGVDEVWFVNNVDVDHQLGLEGRRLERLDARTGETTGQWPWPKTLRGQSLSHTHRNFLLGTHAGGRPVLVTAQGTYENMALQAFNPDMSQRWVHEIPRGAPGAQGSHMSAIVDIDGDGVDEIMWGERCIEVDCGKELFCCDRESYRGHSDIVQPVLDETSDRWFIFSIREGDQKVSPRVALFDDAGRRVWGDVDEGHMDIGWVARIGEGRAPVAAAVRIGHKTAGPHGFKRSGMDEFTYDALTGGARPLPFEAATALPADIDGDGYHEFFRPGADGGGEIIDREGEVLGRTGGRISMASKFREHPGEQALVWHADGKVEVWADADARDTDAALSRYVHPFYAANRRLTATGYNIKNLGGI